MLSFHPSNDGSWRTEYRTTQGLTYPPTLLTTTVLVAEVREAPHVGQIDGEPDDGQQKVHLPAPGFALFAIVQLTTTTAAGPIPWQQTRPALRLDLADGGHRQGGSLTITADAVFRSTVQLLQCVPFDGICWKDRA